MAKNPLPDWSRQAKQAMARAHPLPHQRGWWFARFWSCLCLSFWPFLFLWACSWGSTRSAGLGDLLRNARILPHSLYRPSLAPIFPSSAPIHPSCCANWCRLHTSWASEWHRASCLWTNGPNIGHTGWHFSCWVCHTDRPTGMPLLQTSFLESLAKSCSKKQCPWSDVWKRYSWLWWAMQMSGIFRPFCAKTTASLQKLFAFDPCVSKFPTADWAKSCKCVNAMITRRNRSRNEHIHEPTDQIAHRKLLPQNQDVQTSQCTHQRLSAPAVPVKLKSITNTNQCMQEVRRQLMQTKKIKSV